MAQPYVDRRQAGVRLAQALAHLRGEDLIVLALPRGGVPVAHEVARTLGAPLDVVLVRKLGVPGHEELAMGAIGAHGVRVLNQDVVRGLGLSPSQVDEAVAREQEVLTLRDQAYRHGRPPPEVAGRTAVVVDDGLATGATMRAAVAALAEEGPGRLVVAVPVAARSTLDALAALVDEVVCPMVPRRFSAVGRWYEDFRQVSDDEVRRLLADAPA